MTLLIWLRVMADLSFYYAFAGFCASFTGPAHSLPGIIVPSLLCALARRIGNPLRMAVVVPGLLCLLLPGMSSGDRIALLPALLYCGYLAWTDNYDLSHSRQADVFLLFGKTYPIFFLLMLIMSGPDRLLTYSLFPALLTVILCVFLLRILRHDPEVYLRPGFLLNNLLTLGILLAAAWLLHLQAVTDALKALVLTIYDRILAPILIGILYVVVGIVSLAVTPLLSLLRQDGENETLMMETDLSITGLTDPSSTGQTGAAWLLHLLQALGILVILAAAVAILLLLFRYLAGNRTETAPAGLAAEEIHSGPERPRSAADRKHHVSPRHPVNRVRRQYRKYLVLCRHSGFTPPDFFTSEDIREGSGILFSDTENVGQLREIYIRARYQGTATREDADRAEEIVRQLQKNLK